MAITSLTAPIGRRVTPDVGRDASLGDGRVASHVTPLVRECGGVIQRTGDVRVRLHWGAGVLVTAGLYNGPSTGSAKESYAQFGTDGTVSSFSDATGSHTITSAAAATRSTTPRSATSTTRRRSPSPSARRARPPGQARRKTISAYLLPTAVVRGMFTTHPLPKG